MSPLTPGWELRAPGVNLYKTLWESMKMHAFTGTHSKKKSDANELMKTNENEGIAAGNQVW